MARASKPHSFNYYQYTRKLWFPTYIGDPPPKIIKNRLILHISKYVKKPDFLIKIA